MSSFWHLEFKAASRVLEDLWTPLLYIEITVAKIENNKALGGGEVTVGMIKAVGSIGMQWIYTVIRN